MMKLKKKKPVLLTAILFPTYKENILGVLQFPSVADKDTSGKNGHAALT